MDEKKKFADYIVMKRKEANLTQNELARKLYVTNTAVSKWERGISYPDIALVKSLSDALGITVEELINASDDIQTRVAKVKANYYNRTSLSYHLITLGAYILAIIATFVVNLIVDQTLSWFFIVLTSCLLSASLTNLPFLKRHINFCNPFIMTLINYLSPLVLLIVLLLAIAINTSFSFFLTTIIAVLLAYSIVILPFLTKKLSIFTELQKIMINIFIPLIILILYLLYLCVRSSGNWFLVATLGILVAYELFVLPFLLDKLEMKKRNNFLITLGITLLTICILIVTSYLIYYK